MSEPVVEFMEPDASTPPMRVEVGVRDDGKLEITVTLGAVGPLQASVLLLETAAQLMLTRGPNGEHACNGFARLAPFIRAQASALRVHGMEEHNSDL